MHVHVTLPVLLLASALLVRVHALPSGAPAAACGTIFPVGHSTSSQSLTTSPYALNMSSLADGYLPGQTYILILSGTQTYRGLLVQARTMADGSPVGSFEVASNNTKLSSCPQPKSAITHNNRLDKNNEPLSWTAPAKGTGSIQFLYAVVERFSTFWAPIRSDSISERVAPSPLPSPPTSPPPSPPPSPLPSPPTSPPPSPLPSPPTSPSPRPVPLHLTFTGDTPVVVEDTVRAQVSVSRLLPLKCQIITRKVPKRKTPTVLMEKNCTNGEVTFSNVPNGTHRLRVVAGVNEEAIRSRVIIMPGNSDFCSLNAINEGTTVEYKSNATAHVTFEFRPIGRDVGFMCKIDNGPEFFLCVSPLQLLDQPRGIKRLKVIPNPKICRRRNRKSLKFRVII